jgi:hypothetical protein
MADSQRYGRVPAELGRAGWQRTAAHTATAGTVQGTGTSQQKALDDLGTRLAAMAARGSDQPSAWWDDANCTLWVAYPDTVHGGHRAVAVHMTGASAPLPGTNVYAGLAGTAPASEAFATSEGMERVR